MEANKLMLDKLLQKQLVLLKLNETDRAILTFFSNLVFDNSFMELKKQNEVCFLFYNLFQSCMHVELKLNSIIKHLFSL